MTEERVKDQMKGTELQGAYRVRVPPYRKEQEVCGATMRAVVQ